MDNRFVLNEVFEKNAKVYQTRPVRAMRYQKGMENGWMLYITDISHKKDNLPVYAGIKFFDTEEQAMRYVEANNPEYMNINAELVKCEVEYDLLRPVLRRKFPEGEERLGVDFGIKEYTLVSDESELYDFYILEDETWIVQDADGNVRVWQTDYLEYNDITIFGSPEEFVYEKVGDEYIKVQM